MITFDKHTLNLNAAVIISDQSVRIIMIQSNDHTAMDRLFGKELSNLLDPLHYAKNQCNLPRIPSKSTRFDDHSKNVQKRPNRSQNNSFRHPKSQDSLDESKVHPRNSFIDKEIPKPINDAAQTDKDVQLVPEYFDECLAFMLQQEEKTYDLNNYMGEQVEINNRMRGILVDWLADLHYKFKMFPETLFALTMILDKYLSKKPVTKDNLQLVGTAALFIASKYEETYQVPEIQDLVHYSANAFTRQEVIKMEADIIETLGFDLIMGTSFRFFEALGRISKMDAKNFHLAQYVLELCLLDTRFLDYKPSLLASAAIYLINKIRKRSEAWPDLLIAATNYEEKELRNCARELCQLLEKAEDLPNTKSLKKKFSTAQYNEVTRIRLERRK